MDELNQLKETVSILEQQVRDLKRSLEVLKRDLRVLSVDEFTLGNGGTGVTMNSEGFWTGTRSFTQATSTPPAGTAIAPNGDFYPKGGVTGTYIDGGGQILTITRGIITGIT